MARWPNNLSAQERFESARVTTSALVDRARELINLHENNRFIAFDQAVADKVPKSYAAHTFNLLRNASLSFELIRLCALWDKPDVDVQSVPAVRALLDSQGVTAIALATIRSHWSSSGTRSAFEIEREELERSNFEKALRVAAAIEGSSRLERLGNFRSKFLAHNLAVTRLEKQKGQTLSAPKLWNARAGLMVSVSVIHRLHSALFGSDFDFEDVSASARRDASEFWKGLSINLGAAAQQ